MSVAVVNFQVSILKVLASYPNGLAKHVDVKRDLALLAISGADWSRYSKRLGAAFPSLDVFMSGMVQIYYFGWRLTAKGAIALEMMEEAARSRVAESEIQIEQISQARKADTSSDATSATVMAVPEIAPTDPRAHFTVIEGGRSKAA